MPHRVDCGSKNEVFEKAVAVRAEDQQVGAEIIDRQGNARLRVAEAEIGFYFEAFAGQCLGVVKKAFGIVAGLLVADFISQ